MEVPPDLPQVADLTGGGTRFLRSSSPTRSFMTQHRMLANASLRVSESKVTHTMSATSPEAHTKRQ
jgi:hypothetical protein